MRDTVELVLGFCFLGLALVIMGTTTRSSSDDTNGTVLPLLRRVCRDECLDDVTCEICVFQKMARWVCLGMDHTWLREQLQDCTESELHTRLSATLQAWDLDPKTVCQKEGALHAVAVTIELHNKIESLNISPQKLKETLKTANQLERKYEALIAEANSLQQQANILPKANSA